MKFVESLLLVICVGTLYTDGCDTGRIFLGSINETYPEHLLKNGIYTQQRVDGSGYPVYKHESRDLYLYRVTGNLVSSFWVVGDSPGSLMVSLSVHTDAESPDDAPEVWRIWNTTTSTWVDQRYLEAKCVDESFMTCTTGRLRMHGLSPWNRHQFNRTGMYLLTDMIHAGRPVYQHQRGNDYLYYVNGIWIVGPEVGRVMASIFVLDYAWRPEYIIDQWIIFNGRQFLQDARLRLTCAGEENWSPAADESENSEDIDTSDILLIAEGTLTGTEDDSVVTCDATWCQNSGTCVRNEVGEFLCACPENFAGPRCNESASCGAPQPIANGRVISHTGSQKHDVAFYQCTDAYFMMGERMSVCEAGGVWSRPPQCVDWLEYIDPGLPAPPPRFLRRQNQQRHRRTRSTLLQALSP